LELWLFKHLLIERAAAGYVAPVAGAARPAAAPRGKPKFVSVIQIPVSR
jgi:hypothetical protein